MLFAALFVWGAFQGTLDIAMNTQAITIERTFRRVLMSGLHGSWSIGSFAGAGIGALAVAAGITLSLQLLLLGTIALLVGGLLTAPMLPVTAERPDNTHALAGHSHADPSWGRSASRLARRVVVPCALGLAAMPF